MLFKKGVIFFMGLIIFISSCNNSSKSKENKEPYNPRDEPLPTVGDNLNEAAKKEQLKLLIRESRKTLDSIDNAYYNIRVEVRKKSLSLYEKEQVNEALMELNDTKDLIVLETQNAVIAQLKQKTASLQSVMRDMNTKSAELQNIISTLTRISGVIEKTTNILAVALTTGIIKPRMQAESVKM